MLIADDKLWRTKFAFITRNGVNICVPHGHPLYLKAKKEEIKLRGPSAEEDLNAIRLALKLEEELGEEFGEGEDITSKEVQERLFEEAQKNLQKQQKLKKQRARKAKSKMPKVANDEEISEEVKEKEDVKV